MKKNQSRGFTLLEILLVVSAIAILAGIVILAVNPSKQLGDTKNAQRRMDVNTILNAVYQYAIDNMGSLPATITTTSSEICKSSIATTTCGTSVNLTDALIGSTSRYIIAIPTDPNATTTTGVGYFIYKSSNGRVTVHAPAAEQGASISVTR